MSNWLNDNSTKGKLIRTIVQGVIGVLIANLDMLIGMIQIQPELKPMIVALVMAVLSPIMSELGKYSEEVK
jgi:uncharacterized YccA/Bax inhibitor family protein